MDLEYAASKDSKTGNNRNITITKATTLLFIDTTPSKVTDHWIYKNYVQLGIATSAAKWWSGRFRLLSFF